MGYASFNLREAINSMRKHTLERRTFARHLEKVAEALYEVEWVDSGDKSDGDEMEAIMKCIGGGDILAVALEEAEAAVRELEERVRAAKEALV